MEGSHFDDLIRSLAGSRRSLLGAALAVSASWLGNARAGAKKKRHKKKSKKPKPNAFGCLDVGQACNGDSSTCCSGICEGAKPQKGKRDTSRCVAHDAGICRAESNLCTTGMQPICNANKSSCTCLVTTGNAGFCGDFSAAHDAGTDASFFCRVCSKDTDCQAEFGSGAACVVYGGICAEYCPTTGGTACMPACI